MTFITSRKQLLQKVNPFMRVSFFTSLLVKKVVHSKNKSIIIDVFYIVYCNSPDLVSKGSQLIEN